jgi:hypothetical protein
MLCYVGKFIGARSILSSDHSVMREARGRQKMLAGESVLTPPGFKSG